MHTKRQQLPLEVSSWMDKDLTLRKISANSRLLTNDTRQNIVLSRHFFSNLLSLSFTRYRKLAEHDFDRRMFLKDQQKRVAMSALRSDVDQWNSSMNRSTTSRIHLNRHGDSPFLSPSAQSLFSRSGTKSDPIFNRRRQQRQPFIRPIKTARPEISTTEHSTTNINQRPPTGRQMSRERLNRLAQPKGFRYKSAPTDTFRRNASEGTESVQEILAKIDQTSDITSSPMLDAVPEKSKGVVDDERFHQLMDAFSKVHASQTSKLHTVKSIVEANPSLQDDEGQWKLEHPSISSRNVEHNRHRQILAEKLNRRVDIFLIDVGA